jgi:hypothetical protein
MSNTGPAKGLSASSMRFLTIVHVSAHRMVSSFSFLMWPSLWVFFSASFSSSTFNLPLRTASMNVCAPLAPNSSAPTPGPSLACRRVVNCLISSIDLLQHRPQVDVVLSGFRDGFIQPARGGRRV